MASFSIQQNQVQNATKRNLSQVEQNTLCSYKNNFPRNLYLATFTTLGIYTI